MLGERIKWGKGPRGGAEAIKNLKTRADTAQIPQAINLVRFGKYLVTLIVFGFWPKTIGKSRHDPPADALQPAPGTPGGVGGGP